jgi:hypothetical protein
MNKYVSSTIPSFRARYPSPLVTTGVAKRGSAPKGGAHSTIFFAYAASETLENMLFVLNT